MSFTWKADKRLYTYEQGARIIIDTGRAMGVSDKGLIMAIACARVESDFWIPGNRKDPCYAADPNRYPHDSESNDGLSSGWYQQQMAEDGSWGWGGKIGDPEGTRKRMDPVESTRLFLNALKAQRVGNQDYNTNAKSPGIWVADVQKCAPAYRGRYDQEWQWATDLFNRVNSGVSVPVPDTNVLTPTPGFKGDPFWLADVLRAEGLKVIEMDGWKDRGQGDQGVLWGAVFHHTGNVNETPEGIAFHPTLGLAAHLLIKPNGDVYVCGIGKANHAGMGSWQGIGTDNANPVTIGVEVAILPVENAPHRSGWPDVQYFATVKTMSAILKKLGQPASHVISHKEWATLGPAGWRQGKWDPGAIDMNIFRNDVAAQMGSKPPVGEVDMATITVPASEWNAVRDALLQRRPSRSIYRDPKNPEGPVEDMSGFQRNIDGMEHQELIERLATVYGDEGAIRSVWDVAEGDGAVKDDWAVQHAKSVLARIDPDVLGAWIKKNGVTA